jgi:dihydroflavonol-4-reductase
VFAVVTGASGHVGATLVRDLLAEGARVRAVLLPNDPAQELAGLDVEVLRGDVLDPSSLRAAFDGADVVFHLAAIISIHGDRDGKVRAVNVDGARNAAEAALACNVRRYVHMSSVHAFDHAPAHEPLDEKRHRPGPHHPPYDRSKAEGEAALRDVIRRGLDAVIVNPCGIIGPRDHVPSQMGRFLVDLAHGKYPALPDGGFNWVDVRDVARSTIAAAHKGRTGENYLLGGHWHHLREIAEIAARLLDVKAPLLTLPMSMMSAIAAVSTAVLGERSQLTHESLHALKGNRFIKAEKAIAELGHHARPLEDTLRDTYCWFHDIGVLKTKRPTVTPA